MESNKSEFKYEIGNKVIITKEGSHLFEIGEVAEIRTQKEDDDGVYYLCDSKDNFWWVGEDEMDYPTLHKEGYYKFWVKNNDHFKAMLTHLKSLGYSVLFNSRDGDALYLNRNGEVKFTVGRDSFFNGRTDYKEINSYDVWALPKLKPKEVEVDLNGRYAAIVTKDEVQVGCQTFSHSVILELADVVVNFNK